MFQALFTSEELRRKSLLYFCVLLVHSGLVSGKPKHGIELVQPPNDVIGAKCGEELRVTCMGKALEQTEGNSSLPDIEWWYREPTLMSSATKLDDKKSEGKIEVEVLVEESYVVRSTLIIRDAQLSDEGVYQCRASNSPSRHKQNVNLFKYWRIEECLIADLSCTEASTVATIPSSVHVIPASSYSSTKLDDIIRSTVMSYDPHSSKPAPASARPAVPGNKNSLQSGTPIAVGRINLQINVGSSDCHGTGSSLHRIHDRLYVITIVLIMTLTLFMES